MVVMVHCPVISRAGNVAIDNNSPVKNYLDLSSLCSYLLAVPFTDRLKVLSLRRNHSINRTMILVWLQGSIYRCSIVKHLYLHSDISCIAGERGPDAYTVVGSGCKLEFK